MCITNIYTDQYPDGKQLEFRTTDRCQDRENGQPCTQFIEENPIRKIQFGEPTTEYMLTTNTPLSQSPTPSPARGTNGLFNPPPGPGSYRGRGNYRGGVGGHFQNLHWNASGAPARAGRGQHAENVTLRHTSPQKLYSPEPVSHESTFQYSGTPHAEDSGSDGQSIPAADGRHGTRVRTREPIYPSQSSQQAGPLTLQPSSRLSVLEENEDWKSRSAGSELLEGETRYEQAQLFFSEAELPPDERIRQQNNEIRRQSAVPIVSNRSRWVGFDTEASRSSDESKGHDSSDEDDMPWLEDDEDEPAEDFTSFSRLAEQRAAMSSFNDRIDDALTEGLPAKASTLASTPAKLEIPLASGVLSSKDTSDGGPSNLSQGQKSSQQNLEENITLAEGEGAQLREWAGVVRSDRITIPERLLRDKDSTVKPRKRASRPKVKAGCHTCKIRRVKCDETRPQCNKCVRSGRQCLGYAAYNRTVTIPTAREISSISGPPSSQRSEELVEERTREQDDELRASMAHSPAPTQSPIHDPSWPLPLPPFYRNKPLYPHQQYFLKPGAQLQAQSQDQSQDQVLQPLAHPSQGRDSPDVLADSYAIIEKTTRNLKKVAKPVEHHVVAKSSLQKVSEYAEESPHQQQPQNFYSQPYQVMQPPQGYYYPQSFNECMDPEESIAVPIVPFRKRECFDNEHYPVDDEGDFLCKRRQVQEREAMASMQNSVNEDLTKDNSGKVSSSKLKNKLGETKSWVSDDPPTLTWAKWLNKGRPKSWVSDDPPTLTWAEWLNKGRPKNYKMVFKPTLEFVPTEERDKKPPVSKPTPKAELEKSLKETACTECHRRKQKCNGTRPCNNCGRRYPPVFCTDFIAQKPFPEFKSTSQNESSSYLPHIQPRRQRTREEVAQIKAARRVEIERRCLQLDPPITASVLAHMPSFQAAIQIIQPLDDGAWEVLKPRLLSHWEAAEWREYERIAQTRETEENFNEWHLQDAEGPNKSSIDNLTKKRYPPRSYSVESLQSLVDSIFSLGSLSSASTAPGTDDAFQRVLDILKADAILKDLYEELTAKTSVDKFNRNFGTLLKRFALDLEKEAKCWNEQRAAQFIRSRARIMAQKIADVVYPSGHESQKVRSINFEQDKAEISDDSDMEEEPDEFVELEKFITSSTAFQKLRDNIRGFLGLEPSSRDEAFDLAPSILFSQLPFAEDNQVDMPDVPIFYEQYTLPSLRNSWYLPNFYQKIRDLLLPEPPIPEGLSRVRWKCPCGETLYDDYQELKPGAAQRMENYLKRYSYKKCTGDTKSITERMSTISSSFRGLPTSISQWVQSLKNNEQPALVNTELRYYSDARTTRTPAHTSGEVFYLLLCHNSGVGAEIVKLRQPDICDINNDKKLFSFLHEEYATLRKRWWTWISLWTLQSIKFVRFELHENELVDVKKLDEVPPPIKDNEYRHGPPNPPELNPPLGSNLLMHLFKHPELAGTKKQCLKKIPRKLRSRLAIIDEEDDAIGWGLQFIEGWSKKRFMYMTALTFGLSSFVVMVLVSILGQNIQNAAAIASFMLSFVTIGIATAQAALHMS